MRPIVCSVLVGREAEVSALDALLAGAAGGVGGLVAILGPAGIGKSRLAREAQARAPRWGIDSLVGRAVQTSKLLSLRPFAEAFSGRLRQTAPPPSSPRLQPYLPALAALFPELATPGSVADGEQLRLLLPEGILRLLEAIRGPAGSLLVLEDFQWADTASLEVLEYLADNLSAVPALCLITVRSDEPSPALDLVDRLRARRAIAGLDLEPMEAEATEAILAASLATDRLPTDLVAFIHSRSEGVPLLIEEIAADLAATGALTVTGSRWSYRPTKASVPKSFRQLVDQRLAFLAEADRAVLEAAAAVGREFDWQLVTNVVGRPETHVLDSLRRGVAAQLLESTGSGRHTRYRFRHGLMRIAVQDQTTAAERPRLARLVADRIQAAHPGLAGEWGVRTAELREEAGQADAAAALWLAAGHEAMGRGALADAELTFERARQVGGAPELTMQIEEALLEVLVLAGKTGSAIELGEDLRRRLAVTTGDGRRGARVRLHLARARLDSGSLAEAEAEVAAALTASADGATSARAHVVAAAIAAERRDVPAARANAELALAEAGTLDLPEVGCQALLVAGRVERSFDLDLSIGALERADALADQRGRPLWRLQALQELAVSRHYLEGGTDHGQHARELALQLGALLTLAAIDLQSAVALDMSDPATALGHIDRCLEACRLHHLRLLPFALAVKAFIHAHLLQDPESRAAEDAALEAAPDDVDVVALVEGVRGHRRLLVEDRPGALVHLAAAMAQVRRSGVANPYPFRGQWALLRSLEPEGGQADRDELAASPGALVSGRNRGCLALAQAVQLGREGRAADADLLARRAEELLASEPWMLYHCRRLVAEVAERDGWGAPEPWLREAMGYFQRVGQLVLARTCRDLLRRMGARLPRTGRGDSAVPPALAALGVTSREVDVLKLLAEGLSNRQIAGRLFLSENTVETHLSSLLAKTGAASRAQLVARDPLGLIRGSAGS